MSKRSKAARRLRKFQNDAYIASRLTRFLVPQLAGWAFESVDVRRRMSRRQQQAVGLGAVTVVGLTTAGVVAKHVRHGSDDPAPAV